MKCSNQVTMVLISNFGLNSNGGGIKVYTKNLTKALSEENIKVLLLIREGIPKKIEVKLPENTILYVIKAVKKLNEINPQFVLSQGGWFTAIPAVLYKIRHPETKIIYLFHTHYESPKTTKQKIIELIDRCLMTLALPMFDWVLFVSRNLKKYVETIGALRVPPQWGVLYGAPTVTLPTTEEVEEFKKKFNIQNHSYYLVGHGLTAHPVKVRGAKLLIDSLVFLPKNVKLILTRKGRFVDELQKYAESKGLSDRVLFTGDLENPHVATLVSDIYTHISYGEGLPLALLEVMSVGKPIVASRVGGIPEAIRHPLEGVLVENEVDQIVSTVIHLLENPKLRKKMSLTSRRAVTKRFSWKKTAKQLVWLYSNDHLSTLSQRKEKFKKERNKNVKAHH